MCQREERIEGLQNAYHGFAWPKIRVIIFGVCCRMSALRACMKTLFVCIANQSSRDGHGKYPVLVLDWG